jgi:hypothetical protein
MLVCWTSWKATMPSATGSFTVTLAPQPVETGVGDAAIARMGLHKVFEGGLRAEARGQMLAVRGTQEGSAAYVAIDAVDGELDGRRGSFCLHHRGVMARGAPALEVFVVPDSGTGELVGLSGRLGIRIEGKAHFYDFDYELPEAGA